MTGDSVSKGFEQCFKHGGNARFGAVRKAARKKPLVLGKKGKLDAGEMAELKSKLETVSSWGFCAPNSKRQPVASSIAAKKAKSHVVVPRVGTVALRSSRVPAARPQRRAADQILLEIAEQKARDEAQPMLCRPTYKHDAKLRMQDGYRTDMREVSTVSNSLLNQDSRRGQHLASHTEGHAAAVQVGRRRFEDMERSKIVMYHPYGKGGSGDKKTDSEMRQKLDEMASLRAKTTPFALD